MITVLFMMGGEIHISLASKGRRFVLAPRREGTIPTPVANNTNLLSMTKFLVKIERVDVVYTLLPCGNSATDVNPDLPA